MNECIATTPPPSGTIWMMNEVLRETAARLRGGQQSTAPVMEKLICGGAAGLVGQWVTYPLDTVRRRMQVAPKTSPRSRSIAATVRHLVATEGPMALFKGFAINWVKGPVASGIRFTVVETVDTMLRARSAPLESYHS